MASLTSDITVTLTVGETTVNKFVDLGETIHVAALFEDSGGTARDPTTVKFSYRVEAIGTTSTFTYGVDAALEKTATGNYFYDISTSASGGRYLWRWFATGDYAGAAHGSFFVRNTPAV